MNTKPATKLLTVLAHLAVVSLLLLISSILGVMAEPFPSARASETKAYAPTLIEGDYLAADDILELSPQQTVSKTAYLPLVIVPFTPVPWALTPLDANWDDLGGPASWSTNYGKTPEIIVSSNGVELDVLAQDYDPGTAWDAMLLHIEPTSTGYAVTQALADMPLLDRVMGLATDDAGNRYYATAVDESDVVDPYYPPEDTYRSDIVRVIKLDPAGDVQFNIDLDTARHDFNNGAEMIINPMTFA